MITRELLCAEVWNIRRPQPDADELDRAIAAIKSAKNPVIVCGGGVHFSGATKTLADFAAKHHIAVVETQAR